MSVLIIAEAGVNPDGKLDKALKLCDAAKIAGSDLIKFQTFVPEKCIDINSKDYTLLSSLVLSFSDFKKISKHCEDIGIEFCSTPDDLDSLKFLIDIGVKRLKIGSGSLTYKPLVEAAYRSGLPVILSTGMASEEEIHKTLPHDSGFVSITLLHCVSLYSCPIELANLNAITTLKKFGYPVGYSDHTTSVAAIPIAAVALGATIIEKHFTLDKSDKGPDHFMSLNPAELAQMIVSIRSIEKALGTGTKVISPQESEMISRVRKGPDGKQAGL